MITGDNKFLEYEIVKTEVKGNKNISYKLKNFLNSSYSYYTIPGLKNTNIFGKNCDTMVPQGICRMDEYVLITAYDSSKKNNSVIYVLNKEGALQATLVYCNNAHLGGITYDGSFVWIAEGSDTDYVGAIGKNIILKAVNVAKKTGAKSVALKKDTHIKRQHLPALDSTSYCTYFDGRLWVGKFEENKVSYIYGYTIDYRYSTPKLNIDAYIEAPKKTQGICFYNYNGTVYLGVSTSYGRRNNSVIRCYKPNYSNPKNYYDPRLKIYIQQIIKNDAYRTITMPSMSEQISMKESSMYCIFESAANKYLNNLDGKGYSSRPIGSFCLLSAKMIFR